MPGQHTSSGDDAALSLSVAESIRRTRSKLVNMVLLAIALLFAPGLVVSLSRAADIGWLPAMYLQLGLYVLIVATVLLRNRLPYGVRTVVFLGTFFLIGIAALHSFRLIGNGPFLLYIFCIFATIFLGRNWGLAATALCATISAGFGWAVISGRLAFDFDMNAYGTATSSWVLSVAIFTLAVPLVILGIGRIWDTLSETATVLNIRAVELRDANEKLLEEMDQRKDAERALDESENFFRVISENMTDLVAVLDEHGRRLYNSPSYDALFEDPKALIGTSSFKDVHPEDRDRIKDVFADSMRTGIGHRSQYRMLSSGGNIHFLESQGSLLKGSDGEPDRLLLVSRDISERIELEGVLREKDKYLALLQHATAAANEATNMDTAIQDVLDTVCGPYRLASWTCLRSKFDILCDSGTYYDLALGRF